MARRSVLPAHVQAELPERAKYGLGHDMGAPTLHHGETITAFKARLREPSPEMLAEVKAIWAWLDDQDASSVGLLLDIRHAKHAGCMTVSWSGGPSAAEVAEQFARAYSADGTPLIPGWLSLKSEDDWDLRWQPTYGPIMDPEAVRSYRSPSAVEVEHHAVHEQLLLLAD